MKSRPRLALIVLHFIVGLNALAGGYYGLSGAPQVPLAWLNGSPFSDYFIPSLILFVVVGGSQLTAAVGFLLNKPFALKISILAGAILLTWITVQVLIIGYVSWLQPAMVFSALLNLILSKHLARKESGL